MTLAQIATLLFEPRVARYVGRHRAPEVNTFVAIASAPRTLVSAVGVAPAPATSAAPVTD